MMDTTESTPPEPARSARTAGADETGLLRRAWGALRRGNPAGQADPAVAGHPALAGLDLMPNPVLLVRRSGLTIAYANPPAEAMLAVSRRVLAGLALPDLFREHARLAQVIEEVAEQGYEAKRQDLTLEPAISRTPHEQLHVHAIVASLETESELVLVELLPNDQKLRTDREARNLDLSAANKELIRNLAHEIKNPLGGIRGAAQLLELELADRALREYTQVIIKESDRLQTLVDRLLEPHRHPHIESDVNIHEVLERVRSVVLAEFPQGLHFIRDYDASIPDLRGDKEQLIQTVLNIVHNAAQALAERIAAGDATIRLVTRVARQVTVAGQRHKLALDLHIIDNGPGIPEPIRDRIFYPLVSGRDGGNGLGLTLAQSFVHQHDGVIECESRPGCTDFRILVPLP